MIKCLLVARTVPNLHLLPNGREHLKDPNIEFDFDVCVNVEQPNVD